MSQSKLLLVRRKDQILTLLFKEKRLVEVHISEEDATSLVGNIYIGKVQNIVSNIEAAFVEITKGLLCYLPLQDLENPILTNRLSFDGRLRIGDELLVQVTRDAIKTKQPAVTTKISLAGQYVVLDIGMRSKLGMSGKLSADKKKQISEILQEKGYIDESGQIIRGMKRKESQAETVSLLYGGVIRTNAGALQEDLTPLTAEWDSIYAELQEIIHIAAYRPCFTCLKSQPPEYLRAVKEIYRQEYEEIVTDDPIIYEDVLQTLGNSGTVRFYQDDLLPLSKLYGIEERLKEALCPRVWLKSGGYLVIEPTEALTVIDVNTGKYDARRGSHEETALKINLEAAREIVWQMRLRNLSGIIVVDFISMESPQMQQELMQTLRSLVKSDPVYTVVVDITPLGLVEITRKKISKPLKELLRVDS